ncbi:polyprenyl synthetase family protein [Janibacter melonis]|uniref:polyprenyl synthetase family protein n=1 Tax=Janibacter melonis TaxID=262209 RepID=UPI0020446A60|nr:polyprenyl synthetase family protein [Janibacter melonis]MCM3554765.1 polyprenyl synthetase family protein [Janibacter melonis]
MPDPFAADLRGRVQAQLDAEIARQQRHLDEMGPDVADLTDAISSLVRGGKRLRAAFAYWGWRAGGGEDGHVPVALASAMELFQAAALLHDDVMDDSDTRRGAPAAHRALAAAHAQRGWRGDADRFGLSGAILAGNLCLDWCDDLVVRSGLPADRLAAAWEVLERMRTQLMAGQFIDVVESMQPWSAADGTERVERARRVLRYKSAKYSVEHPLLIGAAAAGASPATREALSRHGLALGEAFQLRDDLLGVFGDPDETGKPAGDDLREGKRTVLVARAWLAADVAQRAWLEEHLGDPDLEDAQVARFRELLTSTGAVAEVEAEITRLVDASRTALDEVSGLPGARPEAVEALAELVELATARTA